MPNGLTSEVTTASGRLRTLLDNIPDRIYFKDLNGRFTQINRALAHVFGLADPELAVGNSDFDYFSHEHAQEAFEDEQEIIRTGNGLIGKVEKEGFPDGTASWVTTTKMPIHDSAGKIVGTFGISRDITPQRRLEEEIVQAADREREWIGADLHDELSQSLVAITLMANILHHDLEGKQSPEAADAKRILELSSEVNIKARALARGLAPLSLLDAGFLNALRELSTRTSKLYKVECIFRCDEPVFFKENIRATHFYRIIQQAVNNAARHGKPKRIQIEVESEDHQIKATVKDDGIGAPKGVLASGGMGIQIMQYRAHLIGASLKIEPLPACGTIVVCSLPKHEDTFK